MMDFSAVALAFAALLFAVIALIVSCVTWFERKRQESSHEEFGSPRGEKPEQRARRLLTVLLPIFVSRDEALDSLYLVYPAANERNLRQSIAAAIYVLNEEQEKRREETTHMWLDIAAGKQ